MNATFFLHSFQKSFLKIRFSESARHQAKAVSDLEDSLATEKARSSELESSFEELKSKTAGQKADMEGTISSLQESNTDLSALLETKSTQLSQLTEKSSVLEESVTDLTERLASTNFQVILFSRTISFYFRTLQRFREKASLPYNSS